MLLSNPRIRFFFHTNGTLGNEDTWKNLAKFCNTSNRYITFSVDDIGEDNGKYRIGQTWDLIVRNMQTFINAGGVAKWKMVVFKHNKHKIDELKKVSEQLGFKSFRSVLDYSDCTESIKTLNGNIPKKILISKEPRQTKDHIPKNHNVECQSLINKMMYQNFEIRIIWTFYYSAHNSSVLDGFPSHINFLEDFGEHSILL